MRHATEIAIVLGAALCIVAYASLRVALPNLVQPRTAFALILILFPAAFLIVGSVIPAFHWTVMVIGVLTLLSNVLLSRWKR